MVEHAFGRIVGWEGASLWILDAPSYPKTGLHAHHAAQVTLGLRASFRLETAEEAFEGDCAVVAPNVPHVFENAGLCAHVFVEPESRPGRALTSGLLGGASLAGVPAARLGDLPARLVAWYADAKGTDSALEQLGRALIAALAAEHEAPRVDTRVQRIVGWADAHLGHPVGLEDAARLVGLSPGRARHLFVEQTGIPFRRWFLWRRLTRAVERYADGASLTDAALGAGFADSAHFSRTFRAMFGVTAASLHVTRSSKLPPRQP